MPSSVNLFEFILSARDTKNTDFQCKFRYVICNWDIQDATIAVIKSDAFEFDELPLTYPFFLKY